MLDGGHWLTGSFLPAMMEGWCHGPWTCRWCGENVYCAKIICIVWCILETRGGGRKRWFPEEIIEMLDSDRCFPGGIRFNSNLISCYLPPAKFQSPPALATRNSPKHLHNSPVQPPDQIPFNSDTTTGILIQIFIQAAPVTPRTNFLPITGDLRYLCTQIFIKPKSHTP